MSNSPSSAPQSDAASLGFERDLDEQLTALERALESDPDSIPMLRAVEIAREQRNLVRSLVDQAVHYEDSGQLPEALERWQTLLTVHPNQTEVANQVQRLYQRVETQVPAPAPAPEMVQEEAPAPDQAQASEERPKKTAREVVQKLSDSVAGLHLAERGREAVSAIKQGSLKDSVAGVEDALGWMQQQVNRASDQGGKSSPPGSKAKKNEEGKPLWIFLAGGVAVAALLAMLASQAGGDRTPGPNPLVRAVTIQAAPGTSQIFVDGEPCGIGTCEVQLEAGIHEISARLAGYAAAREPIGIEPDEGATPYGVRLALEPLAPALELAVDLESATVTIDGEKAGQLEDGSLRIETLPFGEHEVRLARGSLTMRLAYRAEPGKPIVLTEPLEATEMKAAVAAGLGAEVRLYSAARDVSVRLDDGPEQEAPPTGLYLRELAYGMHEATFSDGSSVGFETDSRPTLVASLTSDRNVGALRISTGVDGATVYLNGKAYRRKTSRGGLLVYLAPRPYKVRVEKAGFISPPEQTAEIVKGRRASLDLPLEPEPLTAVLFVRGGPVGAEVLVDGTLVGVLDGNGDFKLPGVDPGGHAVEIRKEDFETKTLRREFPKNSEVGVDGALDPVTGTLEITVEPGTANPRLTLEQEGRPGERTVDSRTLELTPGTYTVTAEAAGYKRYAATVRVTPRTTKAAVIQMEKVEIAAPKPRDLVPALDRLGWSRHGELRVRSGGGFSVAPAGPGPGTYQFSVTRQRGKLQWAIGFKDSKNHVLYQVKKNEVVRTVVANGEKTSETTVAEGSYELSQELTFRIEVQEGRSTLWVRRGGNWSQLDRYEAAGVEGGRFAFNLTRSRMLGRTDQVGVREFSFTPAE